MSQPLPASITWRSLFQIHPCADVFPMMSDAEIDALAEDIKKNGLQQPVLLWRDPVASTKTDVYVILDGRNRLEALSRLGIVIPSADDPREMVDLPGGEVACVFEIANYGSKQWTAPHVQDPAEFVIGANIRRRHLTKEQQAELIVKTIEASTPTDRATVARSVNRGVRGRVRGSTKDPILTKAVAEARKHGISKRTVQNARAKLNGKRPAPRTSTRPPATDSNPLAVHYSSATVEHYTPAEILTPVLDCLGCIDLDPCSNAEGAPHVPARQHFTKANNGLRRLWAGRVFMNPPYGGEIDAWIEKLVTEYAAGRVTEAIALVPGRMDTKWFARFRDCVFCAVRGRLTFVGNEDAAPFPSAVVYLGQNRAMFYRSFAHVGDIWIRVICDDKGKRNA